MLQAIGTIIRLVPAIIAAVHFVEEIGKGGDWSGSTKKAAAMEFIVKLAAGLQIPLPENVLNMVSKIIDALIAVLHTFGVFSRGQEPTPVSAAVEEDARIASDAAAKAARDAARMEELEALFSGD